MGQALGFACPYPELLMEFADRCGQGNLVALDLSAWQRIADLASVAYQQNASV
jgi:hypothetical protein